jgi:hypothetical protein
MAMRGKAANPSAVRTLPECVADWELLTGERVTTETFRLWLYDIEARVAMSLLPAYAEVVGWEAIAEGLAGEEAAA